MIVSFRLICLIVSHKHTHIYTWNVTQYVSIYLLLFLQRSRHIGHVYGCDMLITRADRLMYEC